MSQPSPSVSERKEAEKEQRRKNILKAAKKVFTELGFHEATIEKIAQEASLGKGTVYYYYDNKEAILADMMVDLLESEVGSLARRVAKTPGFREALGMAASSIFDFVIEHLSLWHAVQREMGRFREKCPLQSARLVRVASRSRRFAIRVMHRALLRDGVHEDAEIIFDLMSSQVIGYAHAHFTQKKSRAAFHQKLGHSLDIICRGLFQVPVAPGGTVGKD